MRRTAPNPYRSLSLERTVRESEVETRGTVAALNASGVAVLYDASYRSVQVTVPRHLKRPMACDRLTIGSVDNRTEGLRR